MIPALPPYVSTPPAAPSGGGITELDTVAPLAGTLSPDIVIDLSAADWTKVVYVDLWNLASDRAGQTTDLQAITINGDNAANAYRWWWGYESGTSNAYNSAGDTQARTGQMSGGIGVGQSFQRFMFSRRSSGRPGVPNQTQWMSWGTCYRDTGSSDWSFLNAGGAWQATGVPSTLQVYSVLGYQMEYGEALAWQL